VTRPVDQPGAIAALQARIARLEAENAWLRAEAAEHRWTIELNPQVPWTADAAGNMTGFGGRWPELTGLREDETLGQGWHRAIHPDDLAATVAAWDGALRAGRMYDMRHRIRLADGSHRWMRSRARPRTDEAGAILGWYGVTEDVEELRRAEARQAFLLDLGTALQDLTDPVAITDAAAALLGGHLGVAQAGFCEVSPSGSHVVVRRDWNDGRMESIAGTWRLDDFGPELIGELKAGVTVAIPDIGKDPRTRTPEILAAFSGIGIGALLDVPLLRNGRMVALLFLHHPEPRAWSAEEVAIAEETCARLWSAVQRAGAEAALREREAQLRRVQRIGRVGGFEIDLLTGENHRSAEYMGLHGILPRAAIEQHEDWVRRLHPEDRERAERRFLEAIAEGSTATDYAQEYRIVTPEGETRWIAARAEIERDGSGRAVRMLGAHVDVTELKRTEAALAESEARLRTTVETVPVGIVIAELPSGRILGGNSYVETVLRHPVLHSANLDAHGEWVSYHPDGRRVAAHEYPLARMALAGEEKPEMEVLYRRGDGTLAWIRITGRPVRDASGRITAGVVALVDIDRERRAAEALEAARQRLEVVLDGAGLGSWHWRVPEGEVEFDERWATMLGRPPRAVTYDPQGVEALLHPEDRPGRAAALAAHLAGRAPVYEAEFRLRRGDRGWLWVLSRGRVTARDTEGRPLSLHGTHLDITARREAERALASSRERLALASAAAHMGVWDMDAASGLTQVNAEYRSVYGLPPSDAPVTQGEWLSLLHPEDRARAAGVSRAALERGGEYRDEFRILRADTGEERWIAARGRAVGGNGRPRRLIGVNYDVTDRHAEQERQMLLAREVDHRAKNVLAVVRSIVKLTRAEDPRGFAEAVEGRVAALARAHTLLARDRWTGASMAEVIREELAPYAGAGRLELDGPELRLKPDAVQPVSMILHELATNAAKYGALSLPGGTLRLDWAVGGDPDGRLRLTWTERGGPRVAASPTRRGFGSTVVEATARGQLGGAAAFAWEPDGLRCEIAMPADRVLAAHAHGAEEPNGRAAPPAQPAEHAAVSLHGRRVLVVEDEPLLAMETAAALTELGCEVAGPVGTLEEALRLAGAEAGHLDAAVLDVNLAGDASSPVAELLGRRGVPVIHVTGYGTLPTAGDAGTATLLSKPLRDGQLAGALRTVLAARGRPPAS
jgi:PAS domain S-box-containing protein